MNIINSVTTIFIWKENTKVLPSYTQAIFFLATSLRWCTLQQLQFVVHDILLWTERHERHACRSFTSSLLAHCSFYFGLLRVNGQMSALLLHTAHCTLLNQTYRFEWNEMVAVFFNIYLNTQTRPILNCATYANDALSTIYEKKLYGNYYNLVHNIDGVTI